DIAPLLVRLAAGIGEVALKRFLGLAEESESALELLHHRRTGAEQVVQRYEQKRIDAHRRGLEALAQGRQERGGLLPLEAIHELLALHQCGADERAKRRIAVGPNRDELGEQ